jgi:DNA-binding PadR family transcriptional regulator
MYDAAMSAPPLSLTKLWVLTMVSQGLAGAYGIASRISDASLMMYRPKMGSMAWALRSLEKDGLISRFGNEYALTGKGMTTLRMERYRLQRLMQTMDRAFAERALVVGLEG